MHLDESEFFVTLIFQNLAKEAHVMVFRVILTDCVDDGDAPLNNEVLETVLLVEVGEHELLHCLSWLSAVFALLVKLDLLTIHVLNGILQLLDGEVSILLDRPDTDVA
jgi:hypothetical protein